MDALIAIVAGMAVGVAAAIPILFELRRKEPDVGRGFGSVICAFMAIQATMIAVHVWWPGTVPPFGVSATLAFLACLMVGALPQALAQGDNRDAASQERHDGDE